MTSNTLQKKAKVSFRNKQCRKVFFFGRISKWGKDLIIRIASGSRPPMYLF